MADAVFEWLVATCGVGLVSVGAFFTALLVTALDVLAEGMGL